MNINANIITENTISDPHLPFRIMSTLSQIDQLAQTYVNRLLRPLDLALPELTVLGQFMHRPEAAKTVMSLTHALQLQQPAITKNVRKLVRKNHLREAPNAEDARSKELYVTQEGQDIYRVGLELVGSYIMPIFQDWPQRDLSHLLNKLDDIKIRLESLG